MGGSRSRAFGCLVVTLVTASVPRPLSGRQGPTPGDTPNDLPPRSAQAVQVPFTAGQQLTWSISQPGEHDYEAVLTILTSDTATATVRWSWNRGADRRWKEWERPLSVRERRRARSAYMYAQEGGRNEYRGTTPAMISAAVLNEIKTQGRADVVWLLPQISSRPFRGTAERVGSGTEPFSVLMDGQPTTLQGIRVHAKLHGEVDFETDHLFLDDPETPWLLESEGEDPGVVGIVPVHTRLVRIGSGARGARVATELEKRCRTSLHDVFFATGSDALDDTSAPALQALADVLVKHPDWSVTILGHTDSIGDEDANQDLSNRRAERVRSVLVEQYGIAADRLRSEGRGEKEPVADNGTAEGRARNRRVDIERPCGAGDGR